MRRLLWMVAGLSLAAMPARAQDAPDTAAQAAQHFDRGIEFFNEGRHEAALAEFERAYELAPAHQVLYNLGRVHAALGHAVEAAQAYDRYLREGARRIGRARRREVEQALAQQQARIGSILVRVNVVGATINIDGVDVATTPLAGPLPVSAGRHRVAARAPGYTDALRAVHVAGGVLVPIDIELREQVARYGTLRVTSSVRGVRVRVDDQILGRTPLESTAQVRAGQHRVLGTREGYETVRRDVDVADGAEVTLHLEMEREPEPDHRSTGRLRLILPNAEYTLRIDGQTITVRGGSPVIELPLGEHDVELEMADRENYSGLITVPRQSLAELAPAFRWTPDAREERMADARSDRTLGIWLTIIGGVVLGTSAGTWLWNEGQISSTDTRIRQISDLLSAVDGCDVMGAPRCSNLLAEGEGLKDDQPGQSALRMVTASGAILSAAVTALGLVYWLSAPTEEDIDGEASTAVVLGPGSVHLAGRF